MQTGPIQHAVFSVRGSVIAIGYNILVYSEISHDSLEFSRYTDEPFCFISRHRKYSSQLNQ